MVTCGNRGFWHLHDRPNVRFVTCGSPSGHPHPDFSDGGVEGERAWPCCHAIMHRRAMAAVFLSLIGSLRFTFRTRADLVGACAEDRAQCAEQTSEQREHDGMMQEVDD
jgi:hypothetical protein